MQDVGVTRVGNDNWIMAYVHLAHDCQVGNHTVFANNAQLAGHVHVGDYAILGGFTGVHQFCRIGAHSITGMGTVVLQDIPPFVMASDNPARPYGINAEGLKRRGFTAATITRLKRAYKTLYKSGLTLEQARRELARQVEDCPEVQVILDFLAVRSAASSASELMPVPGSRRHDRHGRGRGFRRPAGRAPHQGADRAAAAARGSSASAGRRCAPRAWRCCSRWKSSPCAATSR